jgi:hypothetical protein
MGLWYFYYLLQGQIIAIYLGYMLQVICVSKSELVEMRSTMKSREMMYPQTRGRVPELQQGRVLARERGTVFELNFY